MHSRAGFPLLGAWTSGSPRVRRSCTARDPKQRGTPPACYDGHAGCLSALEPCWRRGRAACVGAEQTSSRMPRSFESLTRSVDERGTDFSGPLRACSHFVARIPSSSFGLPRDSERPPLRSAGVQGRCPMDSWTALGGSSALLLSTGLVRVADLPARGPRGRAALLWSPYLWHWGSWPPIACSAIRLNCTFLRWGRAPDVTPLAIGPCEVSATSEDSSNPSLSTHKSRCPIQIRNSLCWLAC